MKGKVPYSLFCRYAIPSGYGMGEVRSTDWFDIRWAAVLWSFGRPGPFKKKERAPTTKGNGMPTTGWDDLLIRGRVSGQVMKLSNLDQHGCKWTGFMCLNWLRPKSWLLQKKRATPLLKPKEVPHLTYEEVVGAGLRTMRVCFCFMFLRAVWSNKGSDRSWCSN